MCEDLKKRHFGAKSKKDLEQVRADRLLHRKAIADQRLAYQKAIVMAQSEDATFATLTIDGADSNKTKVPQHWTKNVRTEYDENSLVEQRVLTVLMHGQGLLHFYVFAPNVAKGMDCVVSCIIDSLKYLPPSVDKLRIQVDGKPLLNARFSDSAEILIFL